MRLFPVLALLFLAACAGTAPAPTPSPTPTPAELIGQAARATQAVQSLRFTIALSGKPVYSDPTGFFAIRSLAGAVKRPEGGLATLTVRGAVGVAEIRTVSLNGQQYLTNPVTGQWQCVEPGQVLDPVTLFDTQRGIAALLEQGIEQPALVGSEELNGQPVLHLRGTLPPERVQPISNGLIGAGPVQTDLWVEQQNNRIVQIILVDQATDPNEPTTWAINFTNFDEAVDLRTPVACGG